jgi:transposase
MIIPVRGAESVEVEFETRTVGPLVLTTPIFRNTGFSQIIDRICPVAEQAGLSNGQVAELVAQCRLSDPRALYDIVDWAKTYGIEALYGIRAELLNDDRLGRMLEDLYPQRARIWGEWVATIVRQHQVDFSRLHADTMALLLAGKYDPPAPEGPRPEPGYNHLGIWTQQLKLFALVCGDGSLPVWSDLLNGGTSDSTTYVPQFEAFLKHTELAGQLPLDQMLLIGDSKMPSQENQLTWLRIGVGYIAHLSMEESHQKALKKLLKKGQEWQPINYVSQHDAYKKPQDRPVYRLLGQDVAFKDHKAGKSYSLRHLYVYSGDLAYRERTRRQAEVEAIESELKRIQGLVNKYDYKSPEIIIQRVQAKAFKKRPAHKYFRIEVRKHPKWPWAPLELVYRLRERMPPHS